MHHDVLAGHAAARVFPHQIPGEKQVDELGDQPGGGGTGDERFEGPGTVTGFL